MAGKIVLNHHQMVGHQSQESLGWRSTGLVWNPRWVILGESLWSVFSKLAYKNHVSYDAVIDLFYDPRPPNDRGIFQSPALNERRLRWAIQRSALFVQLAQDTRYRTHSMSYLRFCPDCLSVGFHAALHQDNRLTQCPIHWCAVICECPGCKKRVRVDRNAPYRCHCGHLLWPKCGAEDWPLPLSREQRRRFVGVLQMRKYQQRRRSVLQPDNVASNRLSYIRLDVEHDKKSPNHREERRLLSLQSQMAWPIGFGTTTFGYRYLPSPKAILKLVPWPELVYLSRDDYWHGYRRFVCEQLRVTYTCVRRHIRRRLLAPHRHCVRIASRRATATRGIRVSDTITMCTVARAYGVWRHLWEVDRDQRISQCLALNGQLSWITNITDCLVSYRDDEGALGHYELYSVVWACQHVLAIKLFHSFEQVLSECTAQESHNVAKAAAPGTGQRPIVRLFAGTDKQPPIIQSLPGDLIDELRRVVADMDCHIHQ